MPPTAGQAASAALTHRDAARIRDTSAMILAWLRLASPSLVDTAVSNRHRKPLDARPVDRIVDLLADGVVLADFVSSMDPLKLPQTSIMRASGRNALSAPAQAWPTSPQQTARNIDARQREVHYRNNTRRVVTAVKKIFDAVREQSHPAAPHVPAAVQSFVGDVASVSPLKDLRPALRLAELVVAASVYGPTKEKHRNLFWELPSDAVRSAFHKSMTSVSQALYLPPPDTLYADGPSESPVVSPLPPPPHPPSHTSVEAPREAPVEPQVVQLNRPHAQEAYVPPLHNEEAKADPLDDGMGTRKFSMVTEDGNVSKEATSPRRDELSAASKAPHLSPDKQLMIGTPATERPADSGTGLDARVSTGEPEVDVHSKSASEEFFTPREHSPSPAISKRASGQISSSFRASRVAPAQVEDAPSDAMPASGLGLLQGHRVQPTPQDVDENVRQSVSTSIAKQISQVPSFQVSEPHTTYTTDAPSFEQGATHGAGVFRDSAAEDIYEEEGRAVNFMDPEFAFSPSGSDIPSPSNQWQISRQKALAAEISSPLPLYSPPGMPRRLTRTTISTQMTPPVGPALFGLDSPQMSASPGGVGVECNVAPVSEQCRNQRVSFAPNIISPGGKEHPLGKPLRATIDPLREEAQACDEEQKASFSLPPCAAGSREPDIPVVQAERVIEPEPKPREVSRKDSSPTIAPEDIEEEEGVISKEPPLPSNDDLSEKPTSVTRLVKQYEAKEQRSKEGYSLEKYKYEHVPSPFAEQIVEASPRQTEDSTENILEVSDNREQVERDAPALSTSTLEIGDDGDIFAEIEALKAANPDITYLSQAETPVSPPPGYPGRPRIPRPEERGVPPTPPSPPTLAALVDSFTERRQSTQPSDVRPVSTMAPSPGLFQRLIAVWQNTEDGEETVKDAQGENPDHEHVPDEYKTQATSQQSTAEPTRSMSTHESTLPSGDTDMNLGSPVAKEETSKSRRPRAVRLSSGSFSSKDLGRFGIPGSGSDIDDKESVASKGSVASFSDAFSSDRDRNWLYSGEAMADQDDWEAAMKGDDFAGIPLTSRTSEMKRSGRSRDSPMVSSKQRVPGHEKPPLPPSSSPKSTSRKTKSHSTSTTGRSVAVDGEHIKVDRRRLDWLTRELLTARDVIARQELQMTFAETQRMEQEEILLLDKQNAESVVSAMKEILSERENELQEARTRLSVAIQGVSQDRSSHGSRTSMSGQGEDLAKLISEGNEKLRGRIDESDNKNRDVADEMRQETQGLWTEVKKAMIEQMAEMNEKRDAELDILKSELDHRQMLIDDLQKSTHDLRSKNENYQTEVHAMRLEKEKSVHKYQLEMAHVTAQVELVNEFSKKLHDNFRETENLRQQVLQYQDKLSHITSTSGVSQRQIKELREAVTRANDECARWRREAEMEKRKGMEAERRAEELEELRHKDAQASASRFPDRGDSGSLRSADLARSPGRPSGSAGGSRYGGSRSRNLVGGPTPAQKAWLVIKDKIGGMVTGKENGSSRRRGPGYGGRRDVSRGSGSRSSGNSRSRYSPRDEEMYRRSRTESVRSRSSNGSAASSVRSGTQRSGESGRRGSPVADVQQYLHDSPRMAAAGEVSRIRAIDF